jgi:hypothetical protein
MMSQVSMEAVFRPRPRPKPGTEGAAGNRGFLSHI